LIKINKYKHEYLDDEPIKNLYTYVLFKLKEKIIQDMS